MALIHSPSIVTNGLVLCLDAANPKSYPGSGTLWRDLSGKGNNGTLTNGPTYDSANSGGLVFDGVNDFVAIPGAATTTFLGWTPLGSVGLSTMSIEIWFKSTDAQGYLYTKPWNGAGGYNIIIDRSAFSLAPIIANYSHGSSISYPSPLNDGKIHQLICWADSTNLGYYIDGNKAAGSSPHGFVSDNPAGASNSNVDGVIMSLYPYGEGWAGNTGFSVLGTVYSFKIYQRILSSVEVVQNFNALRGRYGI